MGDRNPMLAEDGNSGLGSHVQIAVKNKVPNSSKLDNASRNDIELILISFSYTHVPFRHLLTPSLAWSSPYP